MYCRKCGKEIDDEAVFCTHCGCAVNDSKPNATSNVGSPEANKKTLGIVLGFFIGIIGLIIGICMYPNESEERETFISGWVKGFVIAIVISVVMGVIVGVFYAIFVVRILL